MNDVEIRPWPRVIRIARARSGVRLWKIVYGGYFGIAEGVRAVPAGRYDSGGCLPDTHVQNLLPPPSLSPFLFLSRVSPPSGKVVYSPGRQGGGGGGGGAGRAGLVNRSRNARR